MKNSKKVKNLIEKKSMTILIAGILGWVVYIIGSIVDSVFAGNISEEALAGVEIVVPFYTIILFVACLFCEGASIKFSRYLGEGKTKEARELFGHGLFSCILSGIVIASLMYFLKGPFLRIFADPNTSVYKYAEEYYFWFIPLAVMYPVRAYIYRICCEDAENLFAVLADAGEMVTNLVLSTIFVRTMGVKGLSLSTFISSCVSLALISLHFLRKTNAVKFGFKIKAEDFSDMLKLGSGIWLNALFVAVVDLVLNGFISSKFGAECLASYALVNFALNFTELFSCATGSVSGFISICDGTKNHNDIKKLIKIGKKYMIIITLTCTLLLCSLCTALPKFYGVTSNEQFRYSCVALLTISPLFIIYGFLGFTGTYYSCLKRPSVAVINQVTLQLTFPLLFAIGLSYITNSYYGVIFGVAISPIFAFLVIWIYLKKTNKTHKFYEIPYYGEEQFSFDLRLELDEIMATRQAMEDKLIEMNIEKSSINKAMMVLEDLLTLIKEKNDGRNKIISDRITIGVSEKAIRILSMDDGVIFDVYHTGKDARIYNDAYYAFTTIPRKKSINNNIIMSYNISSLIVDRVL